MILKFLAQNIQLGGHQNDDRKPDGRWPNIVQRVRTEKPDFLLLNEVVGWNDADLQTAMTDFGMQAMPIAPSPSSFPTLLMYNPETVGECKDWDTNFSQFTVHGFGIAGFDVGLPELLSVIPVHIGPFTHEQVMNDTAMIAHQGYKYGRFAVLGGDFNTPAARDVANNDVVKKPKDFQFRYDFPNGDPVAHFNTAAARKMIHADYIDCGDYFYGKTGDKSLLGPTGSDTGRIDRFYVTYPMRNAVIGYRQLLDPSVSDHAGIVITLDTSKIDTNYIFSASEFQTRRHLL